MYSASLIAALIVKKAIEEGNPVTQMKLQKMVYFAAGYFLAKYDTNLVTENFEAWKFGPVIPKLYSEYKLYGSDPIINTDYVSGDSDILKNVDTNSLDERIRETIDYTWNATQRLSAQALSNWTHTQGSPWAVTYKENQGNTIINPNAIKSYFKDFLYND